MCTKNEILVKIKECKTEMTYDEWLYQRNDRSDFCKLKTDGNTKRAQLIHSESAGDVFYCSQTGDVWGASKFMGYTPSDGLIDEDDVYEVYVVKNEIDRYKLRWL
jgi:hypothetical protein